MIEFDCPHCGKHIRVKDDSSAGQSGTCQHCGEKITVPAPAFIKPVPKWLLVGSLAVVLVVVSADVVLTVSRTTSQSSTISELQRTVEELSQKMDRDREVSTATDRQIKFQMKSLVDVLLGAVNETQQANQINRTRNATGVTSTAFARLKTGDSYETVASVFGAEGQEESSITLPTGINGEKTLIKSYVWKSARGVATIQFTDGRLTSKFSVGLN